MSQVKDIQRSLEDITYLLRIPQRKPYGSMAKDVSAALAHFAPEQRPKLLDGVPQKDQAQVRLKIIPEHRGKRGDWKEGFKTVKTLFNKRGRKEFTLLLHFFCLKA
jgi:hypothetical protein